jgi:hypothetical protein
MNMKRILTSIALIASLGTAQAAGPEDVLLGIILGGVIGNAIAKDQPAPQPVYQLPPQVIYQPQPQVIYAPPPRPVCDHYPVFDHYGYHRGWRTICR